MHAIQDCHLNRCMTCMATLALVCSPPSSSVVPPPHSPRPQAVAAADGVFRHCSQRSLFSQRLLTQPSNPHHHSTVCLLPAFLPQTAGTVPTCLPPRLPGRATFSGVWGWLYPLSFMAVFSWIPSRLSSWPADRITL